MKCAKDESWLVIEGDLILSTHKRVKSSVDLRYNEGRIEIADL